MAVDTTKTLGYGGSAVVDGVQVLVTSANFQTATTPSYLEALSIPPTDAGGTSRSRMLHADGVEAYSGSVSFDVTANAEALFTTARLFKRAYRPSVGTGFTVGIYDGEGGQRMDDCYVTNISLSGSPGGLITCSLGFNGVDAPVTDNTITHDYILDAVGNIPYGYWYSGNVDVRDWTLTWNQAATPVYYNNGSTTPQPPRYMKIGLIDAGLSVTTYDSLQTHDAVVIATQTFTLTGGTTSEGYSFGGLTDLGTFEHAFETAADATVGSDDPVLAIS